MLSGSDLGEFDRPLCRPTYHIPTKAAMPFVPSYLSAGLAHSMDGNHAATYITYFTLITLKSFPESINDESRLFAKTFGETSFPMWWVASNRRICPCFWQHQKCITILDKSDEPSLLGSQLALAASSLMCNPVGPASRMISTTCEASRKRMHDGKWY